jgi:hypothetical protein
MASYAWVDCDLSADSFRYYGASGITAEWTFKGSMDTTFIRPLGTLILAAAAVVLPALPATAQRLSEADQQALQRDRQLMMDQLGIQALRPGPSGDEKAPNHANYDESQANPYPDWPDPLVMSNGKAVTSAEMWRRQRRPQIIEAFSREVLGRVPAHVPKVDWKVTASGKETVGSVDVSTSQVVGHVANSAHPELSLDIPMIVVKPAQHHGRMPVLIKFAFRRPGQAAPTPPFFSSPLQPGDEPIQQLVADGWAVALLNPTSIQPDNGAGLTHGIIGLVNNGAPRKPDDWGALRAWAWGASRAYDFLSKDPDLDAHRIGIEGVSRYGKAALVTMAFDERFAMVLVGSSGEGGAKPHRRNFGEAVENLTGSGEYHWMAGNFLKYGASQAQGGAKTAADLPVESSELIALCAPRLTFISYGSPEAGDALWLDQQGSYMATVAAGRVFRLLGAKDLGVGDDYRNAHKPPVGTGLLDGQLAWRQHEGGHTDAPNVKYFIAWADRLLGHSAGT